jgi:lysophospholipase L1-like esterase
MKKPRRLIRSLLPLVLAPCLFSSPVAGAQQFALHDGDTVVFYGDSITAQRLYTRFVEDAVLTRYPKLHIHFVNAGVPGDTVFGGYAGATADRVQRDVAPFHPEMITVMLGMNDGGYGYTPAETVHANFLKGYDTLLSVLRKAAPEAALTLINPTPYDEVTHGTEFPGYSALVDEVSSDVSGIAARLQSESKTPVLLVDFHQPVVAALNTAKQRYPQLAPLMIPDRIHPSEASHWIMAAALLSAWHIDPVVSRVTLDAKRSVADVQKTAVSKLQVQTSGLRWTQFDEALPLPLDINNAMTAVLLGVSTIEQIDQEILRVDGLATGRYQLLIDAKNVATFSSEELEHGVNLALYKTPMWQQARGADFVEERRSTLDQARFILRAEVKTNATSSVAEDRLQVAGEQLDTSLRNELAPKPHIFELRLQQ